MTGSTCDSSNDSKFVLLSYFHKLVFKVATNLVKAGVKFEEYLPIFQGYNSGMYQDEKYKKRVEDSCEREGKK